MMKHVSSLWPWWVTKATVTQAVPEYIEVLPLGASKGRGVQMLLDDLGILPEEMMAIGDGENDLEMLQMAGIGIAMGNGRTAVKAIADYIVSDNNHSGVAEAIEKFALYNETKDQRLEIS